MFSISCRNSVMWPTRAIASMSDTKSDSREAEAEAEGSDRGNIDAESHARVTESGVMCVRLACSWNPLGMVTSLVG